MQPIGVALAGPALTEQKPQVRRGSHLVETIKHAFWQPTPPAWGRIVLQAARALASQWRRERRAGRKAPDLGRVALDVLGALVGLVDHASGRLEPSYAALVDYAGASRSGVARALIELREAGLLAWARRFEERRKDSPGGGRRQTVSCYALRLPLVAERALGQASEVAAALAARRRARAATERQERERRAAEQRAVLEAQRAEKEAARELGAARSPWAASTATRQGSVSALDAAIAEGLRLRRESESKT